MKKTTTTIISSVALAFFIAACGGTGSLEPGSIDIVKANDNHFVANVADELGGSVDIKVERIKQTLTVKSTSGVLLTVSTAKLEIDGLDIAMRDNTQKTPWVTDSWVVSVFANSYEAVVVISVAERIMELGLDRLPAAWAVVKMAADLKTLQSGGESGTQPQCLDCPQKRK
jgi:hypothetical protein